MCSTIVIPIHPGGGKLGNDTELRYTLRSLVRHFRDDFHVVVVGPSIPDWLMGVTYLHGEDLKDSLRVAAEAYPDGFFWWSDDVTLCRDVTAQEMKITEVYEWSDPTDTVWRKQLETIRDRLEYEGYQALDYSTPHGPYWFDLGMVEEGFADWPDMEGKFPWETWILSKRKWPRCHGEVYHPGKHFIDPGACRSINYHDSSNTLVLREYLRHRYPDMCEFEKGYSVP